MPYSLAFLLSDKDLPSAPIDPNGQSLEAFCGQHQPEDDYIAYEGFEPLVMLRRLSLQLGLAGVDYFHHPYSVLDAPAMEVAVRSLKAMERFFRDSPEDAAVFLNGRLFSRRIAQIMGQSAAALEREDHDNVCFYQLLRCIGTTIDQMHRALDEGKVYIHVLTDIDERTSSAIQEVTPNEPRYSKDYLLEIERVVERGADDSSLPFDPPRHKSMTVSDAAKWYRRLVPLLGEMTRGLAHPFERVERAHAIKGKMRKAAIASLFDPCLALEFLDGFALPDFTALALGYGGPSMDEKHAEAILEMFCTITPEESRLFPGTVGESIGLRYFTGEQWLEWDGTRWCVVEDR